MLIEEALDDIVFQTAHGKPAPPHPSREVPDAAHILPYCLGGVVLLDQGMPIGGNE
jgi:hypothetical protein